MKRNISSWGMMAGLLSLTVLASSGFAQNTVANIKDRNDVRSLPDPLRNRIIEMARRPHTYLPQQAFSEANERSQLVQYFLLDSSQFQPNVFTSIIPGINDGTKPTAANAANAQLPTVEDVRVVVEPKPGFPTDPNDPRAVIDMFTDVSGLFVINNEAGWYEGWVIRDIKVPRRPSAAVQRPRPVWISHGSRRGRQRCQGHR